MSATSAHIVFSKAELDLLAKWMMTEGYSADDCDDAMRRPGSWQEELHQAKIDSLKATL